MKTKYFPMYTHWNTVPRIYSECKTEQKAIEFLVQLHAGLGDQEKGLPYVLRVGSDVAYMEVSREAWKAAIDACKLAGDIPDEASMSLHRNSSKLCLESSYVKPKKVSKVLKNINEINEIHNR